MSERIDKPWGWEEIREHNASYVVKLLYIMENGEDKDSIAAIKILLAYGYGSPVKRTELSGIDGGAVVVYDVRDLSNEQLAKIVMDE